jgi:hypothetical protein
MLDILSRGIESFFRWWTNSPDMDRHVEAGANWILSLIFALIYGSSLWLCGFPWWASVLIAHGFTASWYQGQINDNNDELEGGKNV